MRIFLTGATGFVGRHLIKRLNNHEVTCFIRKDSEDLKNFKTVKGDLKYIADVANNLKDFDVVIHLAANLWVTDNHTMYLDNVVATKNIIEACKKNGVKRIITLSSSSATPENLSEYGKTKLEADKLIMNSKLEYTILKPTMIYGDGGRGFTRILSHIKKYPIVPIVGHGKTLMQPVYVEDVVDVIVKCLENPKSIGKVYGVAGPKAVTMNELFDAVSLAATGKKKFKFHIPVRLLYRIINLMHPFNKKKRMTKEGIKTFYTDSNLDISETVKDLGFNPINLEEGLKKALS